MEWVLSHILKLSKLRGDFLYAFLAKDEEPAPRLCNCCGLVTFMVAKDASSPQRAPGRRVHDPSEELRGQFFLTRREIDGKSHAASSFAIELEGGGCYTI
jgi:hypothetical protein